MLTCPTLTLTLDPKHEPLQVINDCLVILTLRVPERNFKAINNILLKTLTDDTEHMHRDVCMHSVGF